MKIQLLKPEDHWTQLKSLDSPFGECNVTAAATWMNAQEIRPWTGPYRLPDIINDVANGTVAHHWMRTRFPDYLGEPREIWVILEWAINVCAAMEKQVAKFEEGVSIDTMLDDVEAGYPVIIGGSFTKTGHFQTITGCIDRNYVITSDPYGDYHASDEGHQHYAPGHHGYECQYTVAEMMDLLHPGDNDLKLAIRRVNR